MATPEDVAFFSQIWRERPHRSEISGKPLDFRFGPHMYFVFSHVLTKQAYPAFRHNRKNIILMSYEEHMHWEFAPHSLLGTQWDWVELLQNQLIKEYHEKRNL